jgi:uncharacterized protein YbjT (DUF2867 family)
MRSSHSVVLLGATGAVGSNVLATLIQMPEVSRITVLARRAADGALPAKVDWHVVDVMDAGSYSALLPQHDAAICTLGVGQPSKVSREEFARVDHEAVLSFAKACKLAGVEHFSLLGSVAANPASGNFYLKSKGQLREAVSALGFQRFSAFQPSMLITQTNRYDLMQAVVLAVWPVLSHLLVGPLAKYRGISVEYLGAAMAKNILRPGGGTEILHWREFSVLA